MRFLTEGHVLVAGSLVLDILPRFASGDGDAVARDLLAQGRLTESSEFVIYLGGAVGNTGLALKRLGQPVRLVSKVGDDRVGAIVQSLLADEKVDSSLTVVPGMRSTASIALAVPGRDKSTIHLRGAAQSFCAEDFTAELFRGAGLFHFGYPPTMPGLYRQDGEGLVQMLQRAKAAGAVTSVDTCLPDLKAEPGQVDWQPILKRALPYVDLFLPSLEEALYMTDREAYIRRIQACGAADLLPGVMEAEIRALADAMLGYGARIVLLKCGSRGLYLRTAGRDALASILPPDMADAWAERELWEMPCRVDEVRSTTGAGDTAVAGFLCALRKGLLPGDALKLAACTAARCVASYDTVSRISDAEEMLLGLASHR